MRKCSGQIIHVKLFTPRSYVRVNYFFPLIDRFSQMIVCLRLLLGMRENINEPVHGRIQRGGTGGRNSPCNITKNTGFLSKIGPDALKTHKATKPTFNVEVSSFQSFVELIHNQWY